MTVSTFHIFRNHNDLVSFDVDFDDSFVDSVLQEKVKKEALGGTDEDEANAICKQHGHISSRIAPKCR